MAIDDSWQEKCNTYVETRLRQGGWNPACCGSSSRAGWHDAFGGCDDLRLFASRIVGGRSGDSKWATVVVVKQTGHVGGMETGIAITDPSTSQYLGGIAHEFIEEVSAAEASREGISHVMSFRSKTIPWCKPRSWDREPRVAKCVFKAWIRKGHYRVLLNKQVVAVKRPRFWFLRRLE